MAISRSLMNRELQANGGIMQVAPREKFGLGSKLKSFVRKIIPNEVAEVATTVAPFVAPFNPAVAAAMSGIGAFDQTGSIGDSLKGGALTYGLGQGARFLGGAGFQQNPFASGGAFTPSGFTQGFSSPIGRETGLGKFLSNRGTEGVKGVGSTTGDTSLGEKIAAEGRAINAEQTGLFAEGLTGGTKDTGLFAEGLTGGVKDNIILPKAKPDQGFVSSVVEKFQNKDYSGLGQEVINKAKEGGKALFTTPVRNKEGNIIDYDVDKAAVFGALAFTTTYAEARALAAETGVDDDLTEAEYDELTKADKKEEYASYLTDFFAGKKDGGRIGFSEGADQKLIDLADYYMERGLSESEAYETAAKELYKADGGRIGFARGTSGEPSEIGIMTIDVEAGDDEEDENDLMAGITFSKAERAYLYKRLGSSYTSNKSKSMPNLYDVLNNPGSHPADAAVLKQIAIMGMKKDGGRIMFAEGTPNKELEKILATDMTISDSSNDPRNMTTEQLIAIIQTGRSTPEMFEELMLRGYTGVDSLMVDEIGGKRLDEPQQVYSFSPDRIRGGTMEDFLFKLRESNPDIYGEYRRPRKPEGIMYLDKPNMKDGGRIKYAKGANRVSELLILRDEALGKGEDTSIFDAELFQLTGKVFNSIGGLSEIPTGQIRKNNAGVIERDYRDEGGFVPVGIKERADDVPAMLSKNEFVMTADAVRGIGDGDVEKGSKRLYNTMKQAEKVGKA